MKKVWSRWIMIAMAAAMMSLFDNTSGYGQGSVSMQVFYDELQPYGTWMDHGRYGQVWMPRVDAGFTPYGTNGYWVNTNYGNTWVSDYTWGWAPFHYGRWFYDDFYGWMWVPDTEWAPAWVAWRSGGGYYGWAPLMPGSGISVSMNYYNNIPYNYWNFVPHRYIMYRHVYTHCVPRPQVVNVIHNTTIVTHNYRDNRDRTYFTGPSRSEIERRNHERVPEYTVSDRSRPGRTEVDRGAVSFYKPDVENSGSSRSRAIPSTTMRDERRDNMVPVESRRDGSNSTEQRTENRSVPQYRESSVNRERDSRTNREEMESLERQRAFQQQRERQSNEAMERQRELALQREQQNIQRQQRAQFENQQRTQQNEETFRRSQPSRTYEAPRQQGRQYNPGQQRQQQQPGAIQNNSRNSSQQAERGQQFNRSTMENRSSQPRQSNVRRRAE